MHTAFSPWLEIMTLLSSETVKGAGIGRWLLEQSDALDEDTISLLVECEIEARNAHEDRRRVERESHKLQRAHSR